MLSVPGNKEKVEQLKTKALSLMERCKKEIPETVLVTTGEMKFSMGMIYHEAGDDVKAEKEWNELFDIANKEIAYFLRFNGRSNVEILQQKTKDAYDMMDRIVNYGKQYKFASATKWEKAFKGYTAQVQGFLQ